MQKHLEVKTIEHKGIKIKIKIDYDERTAALVEDDIAFDPKRWVFAGRGLNYMDGWLNIIDAMRVAVQQCKKDLLEREAEDEQFKDGVVAVACGIKYKKKK